MPSSSRASASGSSSEPCTPPPTTDSDSSSPSIDRTGARGRAFGGGWMAGSTAGCAAIGAAAGITLIPITGACVRPRVHHLDARHTRARIRTRPAAAGTTDAWRGSVGARPERTR